MIMAQLRPQRLRPFAWLLLLLALLAPIMAAGRTPRAQAGDDYDPALAVRQDLTAKGYDVIDVGLVEDDATQPGVIMTIVSQQLDARVTAQLQDGWTALNTYYKDPVRLYDYLEYQRRYWLIWAIDAADWQAWLKGELASEDFWSHVDFGVYDTVTGQPVESGGFLDKNFIDKEPPGPTPPTDPTNNSGASGVLLEASSAFIPVASGNETATLLARLTDEEGQRLPGQPVTFTVSSGVGAITPGRANADEVGIARVSYSAALTNARTLTTGLPVEVIAYGSAGSQDPARLNLLLAPPPAADLNLAKERVVDAMQLQDYRVRGVDYEEAPYPVGNVTFIYGGPIMDAVSSQLDAALFHQIKLGLGTARAAFARITNPITTVRLPYNGKIYDIRAYANAQDWDSWVAGTIDEAEFWRLAQFEVFDEQSGQEADSRNFTCKNFGPGCGAQQSELPQSASASVTEEDYGVQHNFGKILIAAGDSAKDLRADLSGDAKEWRIYQAPNFIGDPIYSSADDPDGAVLRDLQLGPGQYVIAVYSDNPPATLILHYTELVSY